MSSIFKVNDLVIGKTKAFNNQQGVIRSINIVNGKRRFDVEFNNNQVASVACNAIRLFVEGELVRGPPRQTGIGTVNTTLREENSNDSASDNGSVLSSSSEEDSNLDE